MEQLGQKRIGVVFRENEQGRIYGVTFIDHDRREVFNGSRMGKGTNLLVADGGLDAVVVRLGEAISEAGLLPGDRVRACLLYTSHCQIKNDGKFDSDT